MTSVDGRDWCRWCHGINACHADCPGPPPGWLLTVFGDDKDDDD